MNNFTFYNPVRVHFGAGQIEKIADEIPADSKVLLVYGGGSVKLNGVYDQVVQSLDKFQFLEFAGIEPNPQYETLMRAVELIRKENVNYVLAVGGGSVIDGVKFIVAAVNYEGDEPWDILAKRKKITSALPFGVVLTLPATGSEMNPNAVISRKSTREKLAFGNELVFPVFSILDPQVVFSLPERQLRNGIVDSFVHVIEQYLTYPANADIQDRWAESILISLIESGEKVLIDPKNYHNASNLMWAATMALNGIICVGCPEDWSTHMIGHELTALHGIDHAVSLSIVLPGVMTEMMQEKYEKLLQYANRVWNITEGSEIERINKAIEQTEAFFNKLGLKTHLEDYNIGPETINEIVLRFEARPGFNMLSESGNLSPDRVRQLLLKRL